LPQLVWFLHLLDFGFDFEFGPDFDFEFDLYVTILIWIPKLIKIDYVRTYVTQPIFLQLRLEASGSGQGRGAMV